MSASDDRGFRPREVLQRAKSEAASRVAAGRETAGAVDAGSVGSAVRRAPNALRRAFSESTPTGILTMFPA